MRRRARTTQLVCVVLCVLALTASCARETDYRPPTSPDGSGDSSDRDSAAGETLSSLATALEQDDADGVRRLSARGRADDLSYLATNAGDLGLSDVDIRFVSESGSPSAALTRRYGQGAFVAAAQWSYRLRGIDRGLTSTEVSAVMVPQGGGVRLAALGGYGDRTPLWLAGPVDVLRRGRATVIADHVIPGSEQQRLAALAGRAVRQVHRVLTDWDGPLVVEAPGGRDALDAAVDARPGEYDDIAGVTTTVDGSVVPGHPVHVFLNRTLFENLKPTGAQVVMSHEATHVATEATFHELPEWLLEGFADYVALRHAGVPVQMAAGQIIPQIRKQGLPPGLPGPEDLQPTAKSLGATYEEAWLACRFLGQRYGQDEMVAFYRAVSGGQSAEQAFRRVLGTTQAAFVRAWRADLTRLAGGAPMA